MYVCSPIVDPMIAANVAARLLRVIRTEHTSVRVFSLFAKFKCAHYVPLRIARCNIIHIIIYNKASEQIEFMSRKVEITLPF